MIEVRGPCGTIGVLHARKATDARAALLPWWNCAVSDNPFGMQGYTPSTYGESMADVYDSWYSDLGDHDLVDTLVRLLPAGPADILELGVGTGRLLDLLVRARKGTADRTTGIDTSAAMIERARRVPSLAAARLDVGDFSSALPDGPHDLVFCGYNTFFNLPDTDAMSRAMRLVRSVLRDGGMLVIDAFVPGAGTAGDRVSIRTITADSVVMNVSVHDESGQRITGQFVELRDGAPVRLRPWAVRYVLPGQLDEIAHEAGLRLVERHADGRGTPFTPGSRRHVSVYGALHP